MRGEAADEEDWFEIYGKVAHHFPGIDLDSLPVDAIFGFLARIDEITTDPATLSPREQVERAGRRKKVRNVLREPWRSGHRL